MSVSAACSHMSTEVQLNHQIQSNVCDANVLAGIAGSLMSVCIELVLLCNVLATTNLKILPS